MSAPCAEDEIAALGGLDLEGLRTAWRHRFGEPPLLRSVELLALLLAWRIQACQQGGLDAGIRAILERSGPVKAEGLDIGVGAVLRREWKGRVVEVLVEEDGFRWEGEVYASLSAAATAIAGSRWNGPRFFGLRTKGAGIMTRPAIKRCAIYTRKSSEEGLDQAFNSLDAQREACAAYITSQAGEGWRSLPGLYDDGGISGATMERPGLQNLLAEIRSGQVDVVVVYKIDRLTRSLADFARMVEVFDAHQVSFVSVTQAFNTTSSMGRLTLNVLLSFAQFEREVTGERIRDKIAASKAKGMWMGGAVPLGYDLPAAGSRALRVNDGEALSVRQIFERYLALGSVHKLEAELAQAGIRSKQRITAKGRAIGGKAFSRGALFHLLRNKIYLGLIVHKDAVHPGQHPAIIEPELFEAVRARLSANARRTSAAAQTRTRLSLTGRIFDADGDPMSPTTARGSKGKLYRYYVSAPLQQGRPRPASDTGLRRVAATQIEVRLAELVNRLTGEEHAAPLALVRRIEVHADHVRIRLPADRLTSVRERLAGDEAVNKVEGDRTCRELIIPMRLKPQSGRCWIEPVSDGPRQPAPGLVSALRQAHAMMTRDARGLPMLDVAPTSPYRRKLIRLALLAPDLQKQILDGRQPPGLTVTQLIACDLPLSWPAQRATIQALATTAAKS